MSDSATDVSGCSVNTGSESIEIRSLADGDDLLALTALLHRAYASLGAMGLNYTAVDQSVETTRDRIAAGACLVATSAGRIVGTVVVRPAREHGLPPTVDTPTWYQRSDVAVFGQLGVEPDRSGQGIGGRLIGHCEAWARGRGFDWMALDTAEPASRLRTWYLRLGYSDVDTAQWVGKHYRSVIMAKRLSPEPT